METPRKLSKAPKKLGFSGSNEDIFLAGHSLGGTCANTMMQAYSFPWAGLIVMGAFVDESGQGSLYNYPVPVLSLEGDLDGGMARPGRMALWVEQATQYGEEESSRTGISAIEAMSAFKPVVILRGISHSSFCPGFTVPHDLTPEMPVRDAAQAIGMISSAFLDLNTRQSGKIFRDAMEYMQVAVAKTKEFLEPMIKFYTLEVDSGRGLWEGGKTSEWCEIAQKKISGLSEKDAARITVSSKYLNSSLELERSRTSYHLDGDHLYINVTGHNGYDLDIINTGRIAAASEVGCKLVGADRIEEQLGITTDNPKVTCRDINEYAYQLAWESLDETAKDRYVTYGRPVCFLDDVTATASAGPAWVYQGMKIADNVTCLQVQSLVLESKLDSLILPGNHYCKLFSPARALDWMITDSLKPKPE